MKNTLKQFQSKMKEASIERAWITTPDNIYYLTGFLSDPHERVLALYVTQYDAALLTPMMEKSTAEQLSGLKAVGYLDTENPFQVFHKEYGEMTSLAIEEDHLNVGRYKSLESIFKVQSFTAIDQMIKDMRNIKTDEEIKILKTAAQYADKAVDIGVKALQKGITEKEVVQIIEQEILKIEGISKMSFTTMVLFGDNAANPHGTPGNKTLNDNEFVLFDLGVVYNGYCSDITRTVAFGMPKALHQEIHDIVTEANKRAIELVKPGVKISDIDAAARDYIAEKGYGEYFPHRLGHGLGISVHEFPDISETNNDVLMEGMVFTIEPGVYVPGETGVRVEDDIVVTKDGYDVLTGYEK